MPYKVKGKCVYKKDDGTKVGCTKGDVNKYLAALHANVDESSDNTIKGGKADTLSIKDIADKHKTSVTKIETQIKMGVKVEMEHVNDKEKAKEITLDHLSEFPDYYSRLAKMEKEASKEEKSADITENTKTLIKRLLRGDLY
jgi:hypothetical protein